MDWLKIEKFMRLIDKTIAAGRISLAEHLVKELEKQHGIFYRPDTILGKKS